MSRVAKNPVVLPQGVEVNLAGAQISVKGPLGTLTLARNAAVDIVQEGAALQVKAVAGAVNAALLAAAVLLRFVTPRRGRPPGACCSTSTSSTRSTRRWPS